jgi:hydrogenase expression/formation protein HypE
MIRRALALAHRVHWDTAEDTLVMIDRRSLLVAVALGAVVTGCGDTRSAAPPPPPIVKAEPVVERDVPISAEWVGTLVGYISAQISADALVDRMRGHPLGVDAAVIGVVTERHPRMVIMRTRIGGTRVVDLHPGEIVPRIH